MKRTKLSERALPEYTKGEEIFNMTSHIVGGGLGVVALVLCVIVSTLHGSAWGVVSSCIYGFSMIALYTMSSIYHGLHPSTGKKVLQVIDHCTIYFLIGGTYTPVALCAIRPDYPLFGWGLFAFVWVLSGLAAVFTAIDLKKYEAFSMICYVLAGWSVAFIFPIFMASVEMAGVLLMLFGGVAYTIGAVLYGIGKKKRYMHSIFHLFVVLGSVLQFFSILFYVL